MINETNETIADIINEKRTTAREIRSGTDNQYGRELAVMLEAEADRIEAAHKRADARLRAALKPVLECKVISAMTVETGQGEGEYCAAIIEKAQRIYNEGEESRNEGGAK